jgi:hypothetical protein
MNASVSVEATIKDIRTIHGENSGIDGDGLGVGVDDNNPKCKPCDES